MQGPAPRRVDEHVEYKVPDDVGSLGDPRDHSLTSHGVCCSVSLICSSSLLGLIFFFFLPREMSWGV